MRRTRARAEVTRDNMGHSEVGVTLNVYSESWWDERVDAVSRALAAMALRIAAQSLHRSHSSLGQYYRRMRAKLGTPKAITAVAHKLARIIYHLVTTGKPYDESICAQHDLQYHQRFEARRRKQATALGFDLIVRQTCTK
jgi:hypothetical protein